MCGSGSQSTLTRGLFRLGLDARDRDGATATAFVQDLAARLKNRVQLTSDGQRAYLDAVEDAFGCEIDYAMLIKMYGKDRESEARYSPAECIGTRTVRVAGNPNEQFISTSYVERQCNGSRSFPRRVRLLSG